MEPTQVVEFWYDGDRMTGVRIFSLDDGGERIRVGHDTATELVGATA